MWQTQCLINPFTKQLGSFYIIPVLAVYLIIDPYWRWFFIGFATRLHCPLLKSPFSSMKFPARNLAKMQKILHYFGHCWVILHHLLGVYPTINPNWSWFIFRLPPHLPPASSHPRSPLSAPPFSALPHSEDALQSCGKFWHFCASNFSKISWTEEIRRLNEGLCMCIYLQYLSICLSVCLSIYLYGMLIYGMLIYGMLIYGMLIYVNGIWFPSGSLT